MASARYADPRGDRPRTPPEQPATVDLHTHTTRSDGVLEPAALLRAAVDAGVRMLAITDHDSVAAFRELVPSAEGDVGDSNDGGRALALLPGVEINAVTRGMDFSDAELHILGYGVDPADAGFEATLRRQRDVRRTRFDETVALLRRLGLGIDREIATTTVADDAALGRPTIARALVRAGHAESVDDAFERLLSWGRPAYVPRSGLGPFEAIGAITSAGGLASLAHFPVAVDRISLMRRLIDAGLGGLEVYHRSFDDLQRASMHLLATDLGLVDTGGTDYHGDVTTYAESHAELVFPRVASAAAWAAIAARTRPATVVSLSDGVSPASAERSPRP